MIALTSDLLGLQFLRGMVATVNPCGFVLLPTYLMYFLGVEASSGVVDERASMRRGARGRLGRVSGIHRRVRCDRCRH